MKNKITKILFLAFLVAGGLGSVECGLFSRSADVGVGEERVHTYEFSCQTDEIPGNEYPGDRDVSHYVEPQFVIRDIGRQTDLGGYPVPPYTPGEPYFEQPLLVEQEFASCGASAPQPEPEPLVPPVKISHYEEEFRQIIYPRRGDSSDSRTNVLIAAKKIQITPERIKMFNVYKRDKKKDVLHFNWLVITDKTTALDFIKIFNRFLNKIDLLNFETATEEILSDYCWMLHFFYDVFYSFFEMLGQTYGSRYVSAGKDAVFPGCIPINNELQNKCRAFIKRVEDYLISLTPYY